MLLALAVLLVCYGFYHFVYLSQNVKLEEVKLQVEQKKGEYQSLQSMMNEKEDWEKKHTGKQVLSITDFLAQLEEMTSNCEVKIKSFQPQEEPKNTNGQKTIHIVLVGDFNSLKKFFALWEEQNRLAIISSVKISQVEEKKSKLQADLTVKALLL